MENFWYNPSKGTSVITYKEIKEALMSATFGSTFFVEPKVAHINYGNTTGDDSITELFNSTTGRYSAKKISTFFITLFRVHFGLNIEYIKATKEDKNGNRLHGLTLLEWKKPDQFEPPSEGRVA
jgi:hypothetical protein